MPDVLKEQCLKSWEMWDRNHGNNVTLNMYRWSRHTQTSAHINCDDGNHVCTGLLSVVRGWLAIIMYIIFLAQRYLQTASRVRDRGWGSDLMIVLALLPAAEWGWGIPQIFTDTLSFIPCLSWRAVDKSRETHFLRKTKTSSSLRRSFWLR